MTGDPPRVAVYGYFGMGNLGNEGTLAAFLAYLRNRHPGVQVQCLAADPAVVTEEHHIRAVQLMSYRRSGHGFGVSCLKALSRLWDVPRSFAITRDVDVLVVPGTGVLETTLVARPWGLPYWLFLAVLACRLRGRPVVLVSVGATYATNPVVRLLHRAIVEMSSYCSFRDSESRDAARAMGVRPHRLGPEVADLALALPSPARCEVRPGHLVFGVMTYEGSPEGAVRGPKVVRRYVAQVSDALVRLLDEGWTVAVVVGDLADTPLAEEIVQRVRSLRPDLSDDQVHVSGARTLLALMQEMVVAEVVVGSRFHNVICGLLSDRPTVSLGYADKNEHLLAEFGLERYCQSIDSFEVDRLVADVRAAAGRDQRAAQDAQQALTRLRRQLDEQFLDLSSRFLDGAGADDVGRARHK